MEMYLYEQARANVSWYNARSTYRDPVTRSQPRMIRSAISSIAKAINAAGR